MPFASKKQRGFLYTNKPGVAKKFAEHGGDEKKKAGQLKALKRMIK
jgi:hypothetical protein